MESRGDPVTTLTVVSVGDTPLHVVDELARTHGNIQVVRRCPELSELLAACQSGLAQVAVVSTFGAELTATLIDRLTAVGVIVVAVAGSPEEAQRLRSAGATTVPDHVTAEGLGEVIRAAVAGRRHPGSGGYSVPATYNRAAQDSAAAYEGESAAINDANAVTVEDASSLDPPHLSAVPTPSLSEERWEPKESGESEPSKSGGGGQKITRQRLKRPSPSGPLPGLGLRAKIAARLRLPGGHVRQRIPAKKATGRTVEPPIRGAGKGTVVAVWGPIGSPGRTTVAINLAAEQAAAGRKVMLIDADTYGASVAAALGLLDEAASFAQACRAADQGGLVPVHLAKTATQVVFDGGTFSLLTGLTRADRWPELRAAAVERVIDAARELVDLVIVDCGFALENDEELSYDTVAPRRNAATLAALGRADLVYAVGNSDPLGIPRLIRGLDELGRACPGTSVRVVVNKVRRKAVGGAPERALIQAWERFGPAETISHFLPWDPELTDKAMLEGRLLRELSPDAPLSLAIRAMSCAGDQQNPTIPVTKATTRVDVRG
ncbi:AAA family ATPase [Arthrobacter alpinus]|uniref:AAA family ATPase n=1 Tax=Arthrobacter alpinus TaxID=656366 RepID=UPI0009F8F04E|nr:P-loop NTPase [Arthrobacter alpinus]